jgi:hypothetical protein
VRAHASPRVVSIARSDDLDEGELARFFVFKHCNKVQHYSCVFNILRCLKMIVGQGCISIQRLMYYIHDAANEKQTQRCC